MTASISLHVYAPAGVELRTPALKLARQRLGALGYAVTMDASVKARHQRFAGDDDARLATIHRVAEAAPGVAMACRGGYGLTRLLGRIDWPLLARAVERGTRWVGHSDITALQLGLLAHTGATSWQGPMACDDFGRADDAGGTDEVTVGCFTEAMSGALEAVGFRTEAGFDGLDVKGRLWGGNLAMVQSLLGTPHWPKISGGVLFLEDINEHPLPGGARAAAIAPGRGAGAAEGGVAGRLQRLAQEPAGPRLHPQVCGGPSAQRVCHAHPHRPALRPCADQADAASGCQGAAGGAGA